MENNKLIAEFMGMELGDDRTMYYDDIENLHPPTPINELKFHTSWDWLMPVHKKCMFTPNFSGDDELRTQLIEAVIDADIDRLYQAVVEFIKRYKKYPFEEGDDYWVVEDGELIWSCWDDVSIEIHNENPNTRYFTEEEVIAYARANGIKYKG